MPSWASILAFLSPTCSSAVSSRRGTIAFSSRCAVPRRVGSGVGADIEIGHMSCNMAFRCCLAWYTRLRVLVHHIRPHATVGCPIQGLVLEYIVFYG